MEIGILITYILETSMSHSVSSFSDSLQEMREKLVGTLSHDVRNPVSAAYTAVDMMDCEQEKDQLNKLKDLTKKSLRRSLDLMEGLLDAISVRAGEGITMNFAENNLVYDVKKVHEEANQIYYNDIKFHCEEDKITAIYDGTAIRRILENLITNAVKYGAPDQTIDLIVENQKEKVLLKVHNQGNPISPEKKEIVFQFLNRSEEEASGKLKSWGMGLAFVKMAAEAHGGHVELLSDQEKGTIFTVEIQKYSNQPGKVRARLNYPKK